MQTPTIETKQDLGITEVPSSEFAPVSETKELQSGTEIKTVPVEKVVEIVQENIVDKTPVTAEIGTGYKLDVSGELGLIGEVTGKGLPSDIAREAIDSKIKNLPLVE